MIVVSKDTVVFLKCEDDVSAVVDPVVSVAFLVAIVLFVVFAIFVLVVVVDDDDDDDDEGFEISLLSFATIVDRFIFVDVVWLGTTGVNNCVNKWFELEVVVVDVIYCTLAWLVGVVIEEPDVVPDLPFRRMVNEGKSVVLVRSEKRKRE